MLIFILKFINFIITTDHAISLAQFLKAIIMLTFLFLGGPARQHSSVHVAIDDMTSRNYTNVDILIHTLVNVITTDHDISLA